MKEISYIKIIQTPENLFMQSDAKVYALDIKFDGSIVGEVIGNNNIVGVKNNRMIIVFAGEQNEEILKYEGKFTIKSIKGYSSDKTINAIIVKENNDFVNNIKSVWNTTNKYTDYKKTYKYNRIKKTKMTYTLQGKKIHIDHKNKRIKGIENVRK